MSEKAYAVWISSVDPSRKVLAIMRIREITGVGIAEAKAIVEQGPTVIMTGLPHAQAFELYELLQSAGMQAGVTVDSVNNPESKILLRITFGDPLKSAQSLSATSAPDAGQLKEWVAEIRRLWTDWNPQKICDPEPAQYDAYLIPTLRLLQMNSPADQIVEYLNWVVLEHLGVSEASEADAFSAQLREWFATQVGAARGA